MNKVMLIGRLTKDPDLKFSKAGMAITKFTLAVNRAVKKDAEQTADFINCIAFDKRAETIANYVQKGHLVCVVGQIQTGSYEAQDGTRRYTTDIIVSEFEFLQSKKDSAEKGAQTSQQTSYRPDDIPF